jgi:hypothetical protein
MEHVRSDGFMELRELCFVGKLSGDNTVVIHGVAQLVWGLQDEQEVCMRKATLLKLNHIDVSSIFAKETLFYEEIK